MYKPKLKFWQILAFLIVFGAYFFTHVLVAADEGKVPAAATINHLLSIKAPTFVRFCNETIPLNQEDNLERLDFELINILGSPITTTLWIKRYHRFIPYIEKELAKHGLPDDLKYVSIIESNLYTKARSPANAVGIWQFIESTGRQYGLTKTNYLDERLDFYESTRAAIAFFKELLSQFGSCTLALAAYNAGPGTIKKAMNEQNEVSFFSLKLPRETERYVFRAIAAKLILENPQSYGLDLSSAQVYKPLNLKEIYVELTDKATPITYFTRRYNISYRYFLELNPHLTGEKLPPGIYKIFLPE